MAGGRHPGWGTANRIVPLGDTYLELVSVVDVREAARSPFGRWVAGAGTSGAPFGWAVRTTELDRLAMHHGLRITSGSRARPDGGMLHWRLAGLGEAMREPSLPFFLEWAPGSELPGSQPLEHDAGAVVIAELHLRGDAARIADWLGPHELPLTVQRGGPAVTRVVLSSDRGEIVLRGGTS